MARDRLKVLGAMIDQGVIPVFTHPDPDVCIRVIQACANGGAKCIEFTNRGDFAADVFAAVTRHFAKADPSVIMGVGSVVDAPTAGLFIAHGANFVVGPVLWFGAYFGVLPLVNPVMVRNIDLPSFFYAHVFYSFVLGWWLQRSPQVKPE